MMRTSPARHFGLARFTCHVLAVFGLSATATATAGGYAVAPGSTNNEIALRLRNERPAASVDVAAEVIGHPTWLDVTVTTIEPGPPQAIVLSFDVATGAPINAAGTVAIRLQWRTPGDTEPQSVVRRVPLRIATQVPAEQNSFRVEECCIPTTAVEHDAAGRPVSHVLLGTTPNPWRSLTSIRFGLPAGDPGPVTLRIHDVTGRRVFTLQTPALAAGYHQFNWVGRDDTGALVPSGHYFYEVSTARWRAVGRTMIVR